MRIKIAANADLFPSELFIKLLCRRISRAHLQHHDGKSSCKSRASLCRHQRLTNAHTTERGTYRDVADLSLIQNTKHTRVSGKLAFDKRAEKFRFGADSLRAQRFIAPRIGKAKLLQFRNEQSRFFGHRQNFNLTHLLKTSQKFRRGSVQSRAP